MSNSKYLPSLSVWRPAYARPFEAREIRARRAKGTLNDEPIVIRCRNEMNQVSLPPAVGGPGIFGTEGKQARHGT